MGVLEGKVAAICGGTSGIGARAAALFVAEGARIVVAGRRQREGEAVAAALGTAASFIPTDVAVEADVAAMIAHAVAGFGRLDCLADGLADQETDPARAALEKVLPRWQPLPHVGMVDDIANPALFLASDAARLANGHNLIVDGGISAGWPASVMREDRALFAQAFEGARAGRNVPHRK